MKMINISDEDAKRNNQQEFTASEDCNGAHEQEQMGFKPRFHIFLYLKLEIVLFFMYRIIARYGRARYGVLELAHGQVETPVFMPGKLIYLRICCHLILSWYSGDNEGFDAGTIA